MVSIDSRRGIRHIPDRGIYFRPPEAKGLLVCHILGGADQESPGPAKAGQEQALRFPGRILDNIYPPTRQSSLQPIGKVSRWNFGVSPQTRLGFQLSPGIALQHTHAPVLKLGAPWFLHDAVSKSISPSPVGLRIRPSFPKE